MTSPEQPSSDPPETLALLRDAFDLAWPKLRPEQQTDVGKKALEAVVKRVAKQGETDPLELSARAVKVLTGLT